MRYLALSHTGKVILPALRVVELRLICHSFKVAEMGPFPPADAPGAEHDTSRPPIAMSANPLRTIPVILSSSP